MYTVQQYIVPGFWATMRFRKFRVLVGRDNSLYTWRTPAQVDAGMGESVGSELVAKPEDALHYATYNGHDSSELKAIIERLQGWDKDFPWKNPSVAPACVVPPTWTRNVRSLPSTILFYAAMSEESGTPAELRQDEQWMVDELRSGYIRAAFDFRFKVDFRVYPAMIPRIPSYLPVRVQIKDNVDLLWLSVLLRNYNM